MKQVITLTSLVLATALGINLEAQTEQSLFTQSIHQRVRNDAECAILLGSRYESISHRYRHYLSTCTCHFEFKINGLDPCINQVG